MVDYYLLLLILVGLISLNTCWFCIVYLMTKREREKNKLRAKERSAAETETTQECLHFFGYLAEHPRNQPIPDECFGCTRAMECINKNAMENIAEVEEVIQQ